MSKPNLLKQISFNLIGCLFDFLNRTEKQNLKKIKNKTFFKCLLRKILYDDDVFYSNPSNLYCFKKLKLHSCWYSLSNVFAVFKNLTNDFNILVYSKNDFSLELFTSIFISW